MKQVNILASLFLIGGLFVVVGMGNLTNSTTNANATNATSPISTTDEDGMGGIAGIRIGDGSTYKNHPITQ
jgi:hypothetical protein